MNEKPEATSWGTYIFLKLLLNKWFRESEATMQRTEENPEICHCHLSLPNDVGRTGVTLKKMTVVRDKVNTEQSCTKSHNIRTRGTWESQIDSKYIKEIFLYFCYSQVVSCWICCHGKLWEQTASAGSESSQTMGTNRYYRKWAVTYLPACLI